MESLIIAYDENMHWIYPDLISVLSKKFHFLWNGPIIIIIIIIIISIIIFIIIIIIYYLYPGLPEIS